MLEFMNASRLVEALGLALLHSLWQCLLIGILFKALLSAMRRSSPGMRYWASVGALALLAASVPLTTMYLLAGMPSLPASTLANAAAYGAAADSVLAGPGTVAANLPIVEWTVALWVAGVAVVATRTLMSWRRLSGLRRTADFRAASGLVPIVDRLRGVFGLSGRIAIGFSGSIASPMIIGWLKPVILLPPAVAARLPHEQLEMIIAHELAHLRRQDHWVNLFQVATETLMFYHPVVAMVSRRIRIERENACDDLAVAATERRLDYVEMLAALERQRGPGPALALGVHDGQVVARIRRLVEGSEPGNSRGAAIPALIALAAVAGLATAPLIDRAEVDRQAPVAAPIAPPSPAETETRRPARPNPSSSAGERIAPQTPPRVRTDPNRAPNMAPAQARATEMPAPPISAPAPETGTAEPAAPDGPALAVAQAAESSPGPSTELPAPVEQDARTDQSSGAIDDFPGIETAAPEPAALLASRTEIPVLLPEDSPLVAEEIPPIRGDAQRAAAAVLAGGRLVREIQPSYPRSALRRDISGSVEVELTIDTRGRVADVSILSEMPAEAGFGAAARRAAANWKFEPFTVDGEPAVQRKTVVFDFDPGDGCRMVTGTRLPSC